MITNRYNFIRIIVMICLCTGNLAHAQAVRPAGIKEVVAGFDTLHNRLPAEQIYVHFDKPYYHPGDTVWFKAYVLNADFLTLSKHSGLVYVELLNETNQPVQRLLLPVVGGLSRGQLILDKELTEGSYTIMAYTNLMRNFGEAYVFKKGIYISNADDQSVLVQSKFSLSKASRRSGDQVNANLQFNKFNKSALGLADLELRLLSGKKNLYKDNFLTDLGGGLQTSFVLPKELNGPLFITARDLRKTGNKQLLTIPVNITKQIDLQFMPEGGNLVSGIKSVVGFKAIDQDGKGIAINGYVYTANHQEVAAFKSLYLGIGRFELIPQAGETYIAEIINQQGEIKIFNLPLVKDTGTTIRIRQDNTDSITVAVSKTSDVFNSTNNLYLIAQSRGVVCDVRHVIFNKNTFAVKVSKSSFPTGVAKFTLLDVATNQPINERAFFINHHDNLHIDLTADKSTYSKRDSVALQIKVTDKDGNPVQGSFSLAVTDDAQVDVSKSTTTMAPYLQLTSNLQGTVETPAYYFEKDDEATRLALDNLLLTQGWVGYNWQDVFNPQKEIKYPVEKEYTVQGTVSSISKPTPHTQVLLMSRKPPLLMETQTDKNGHFVFSNLKPADTAIFMIVAKNRKGKTFNVGVEVDEFKPPIFTNLKPISPWYVNTDSTLMKNLVNANHFAQLGDILYGKNVLKEVNITAKRIIKESHNLNGPGEADLVLDEKDMEKAGKMTLGDLIRKNVKAFYKTRLDYFIGYKHLKLIIDGIDIDQIATYSGSMNARTNYIDDYLEYFTAEDIVGLELQNNWKYNDRYNARFLTFDQIHAQLAAGKLTLDWAYIEITTRSGKGPFVKHEPGTYLYKPMALTSPKDFYRPRYITKETTALPDLRSTIHWQPDIVTGADGRATVSFYTTDNAGKYSIVMEGCSIEGDIGIKTKKLSIDP
ncbi:MAG: hypothetical protein V4553_19900 [Bacteroidota bacterium]